MHICDQQTVLECKDKYKNAYSMFVSGGVLKSICGITCSMVKIKLGLLSYPVMRIAVVYCEKFNGIVHIIERSA